MLCRHYAARAVPLRLERRPFNSFEKLTARDQRELSGLKLNTAIFFSAFFFYLSALVSLGPSNANNSVLQQSFEFCVLLLAKSDCTIVGLTP